MSKKEFECPFCGYIMLEDIIKKEKYCKMCGAELNEIQDYKEEQLMKKIRKLNENRK